MGGLRETRQFSRNLQQQRACVARDGFRRRFLAMWLRRGVEQAIDHRRKHLRLVGVAGIERLASRAGSSRDFLHGRACVAAFDEHALGTVEQARFKHRRLGGREAARAPRSHFHLFRHPSNLGATHKRYKSVSLFLTKETQMYIWAEREARHCPRYWPKEIRHVEETKCAHARHHRGRRRAHGRAADDRH